MLGPSVDELDELEDLAVELNGIKFIAAESFVDTYGENFELFFEEGRLNVRPVN